ncbi:transposable element Tcb2 transposase [Trichonephila clavipes]|uniref:Transposable element Tcb2 transposase n=1 Tax=Trichonephila clavipes TaxID=2585209 RepID=A0A8X6VXK8_TRICX|nr:transposable element Tcb2 transposase [Trichonephila clavipes]
MKIGNNGNLVLGPFDESSPCLMIVLMNFQTKLRINHLTAVKSNLLQSSSSILSISTKGRAYFRSVTFLVPKSWGDIQRWLPKADNSTTFENAGAALSRENADVIVTTSKANDYPYALHQGGCGRSGLRIYLPSNSLMGSGQKLGDDFMRGRIIGKIEEGRKITDVAREFDIAHSVVSRPWKSFKTTGMCSRRHGGGRVRRKQISRKTVARRLRGGGLYARRPVVCVPLTRQHRTARLQWCREHHNWTEQDWACVLFSDESRFSLSSDCRRQLIWRESGIANRPEYIQEKDRYPTCSIMVWAGIMINGRTRLHVVANGTMTGRRYIDEDLLPHVRLFRGAVGDKFVFMDDNATRHRTLAVQDCLDSEGIQRLVWPAHSSDLNPIENVWDALGRQVAGGNYPPTNKNTLIRALTEEWDKLPQQLLDNVVQSMVRRVECCITIHGGHIPY